MSELAMDENEKQAREASERHQPGEVHRRQRVKNIALGAVLFGMVALFYVVTIVKMSGG